MVASISRTYSFKVWYNFWRKVYETLANIVDAGKQTDMNRIYNFVLYTSAEFPHVTSYCFHGNWGVLRTAGLWVPARSDKAMLTDTGAYEQVQYEVSA
jgi:hypothetical protein